ncbi:hypothetical protein NX773_09470 [Massilia solisilvae]|uniref:Uncharacterized protein n=1 Tax=Massilia solisilvae TaxID=1811225 RepID=A0ABT2BIV5_9BURK|nr:hypothetical protein [Massilia solisilvae]MCS0608390.1 hypothetical protein [Massilia solisilvae]
MNFTFLSHEFGLCRVRLWASGRYGFSLPKKVEITTPTGETSTFFYLNRPAECTLELSNRDIVRVAIAQFLALAQRPANSVAVDHSIVPFAGKLTQVRADTPRGAPLRVRPGKSYARQCAAQPAIIDQAATYPSLE